MTMRFYACWLDKRSVPVRIDCSRGFGTLEDAEACAAQVHLDTTLVPLSGILPEFINHVRAKRKALSTFVRY